MKIMQPAINEAGRKEYLKLSPRAGILSVKFEGPYSRWTDKKWGGGPEDAKAAGGPSGGRGGGDRMEIGPATVTRNGDRTKVDVDGVGRVEMDERGKMRGRIDGVGRVEVEDGEVEVKLDGMGRIDVKERNGGMEIRIRMGATALASTALTAAGMTLY